MTLVDSHCSSWKERKKRLEQGGIVFGFFFFLRNYLFRHLTHLLKSTQKCQLALSHYKACRAFLSRPPPPWLPGCTDKDNMVCKLHRLFIVVLAGHVCNAAVARCVC